MKKYRVIGTIILGIQNGQEQADVILDANAPVFLECDGHTIWIVEGDDRHESISTVAAIIVGLRDGRIEEI